jgi:predicted nucleotidyltransferase
LLSYEAISATVARIVDDSRPSRVILFGSYARGEADAASDLDLMVVTAGPVDAAAAIAHLRGVVGDVGIGVDLLVYSEAEVGRRGTVAGTAIHRALKEGRTLYDRALEQGRTP